MIQFELLQKKDIETVTALMKDFYAIDHYPFDALVAKKLFEEFITNKHLGECWLIKYNKEVVGYVILTFIFSFEYQGKIAFLDELYLQPKAQGKGIGKKAIAFTQEFCHKNNFRLMYLEVEEHNEKAQQLYLKNGFTIHKRQLMKYHL
jgi:ribosomal protein S18 acetylase RimI-like enzyme